MKTSIRLSLSAAVACALALGGASSAAPQAVQPGQWLWQGNASDTWGGTIGAWRIPSGPTSSYPNDSAEQVYIGTSQHFGQNFGTPTANIESGGSYTVGNLTMDSSATLNLLNGSALHINSASAFSGAGTIVNSGGAINLNAVSSTTALYLGGGVNSSVTIGGGGTITLNSTAGTALIGGETAGVGLILFAGQGNVGSTIQGAGVIGGSFSSRALNIDNDASLINANVNGKVLSIVLESASGANLTNTNGGILRASNGGTLLFSGTGTVFNDGSLGAHIEALNGSFVRIGAGVTVTGGTVTTAGSGTIRGDTAGNFSGTLADLTNLGAIAISAGEQLTFAGAINNSGTVQVTSGGLLIAANTPSNRMTLSGSGVITLSDDSTNYIDGVTPATQLAISAGATIQGGGGINRFLGGGHLPTIYNLTLSNAGLIDANAVNNALNINLISDNSIPTSLVNTGVLRASNGGVLQLLAPFGGGGSGTIVDNSGGIIEALDGSTVRIGATVTVTGGTLSTAGLGTIRGNTDGSGGTLKDLTNAGTIAIADNEALTIAGTITNNGTLRMDSSNAGGANLYVSGDTTLAGSGTLLLSGKYGNFINSTSPNHTLTIGPSAVVQGSALFNTGAGSNHNPPQYLLSIVNQGVIEASSAGNALTINLDNDPQNLATLTNSGILRASGGATLAINAFGTGTVTNNGTLEALSGGSIILAGNVTLTNNTAGLLSGGTYRADGTGSTVDLAGAPVTSLVNGAQLIINGAGAQLLAGGQSIFSSLASSSSGSAIQIQGNANITLPAAFTNSGAFNVRNPNTIVNVGASGGAVFSQTSTGVLSGTGTLNAGTFLLSGSVSPGNSPGTLTLNGNVQLDPSAILLYELGGLAGPNDHLNVLGPLTLAGVLKVSALAGFGLGTYDLIDYSGPLTNFGLSIGTAPAGFTYAIDAATNPGQVDLVVRGLAGAPQYWDGSNTTANNAVDGGTGNWSNNTPTNWTNSAGSVNSPWAGGAAVFSATAGAVTLTANIAFTGIQFSTTGYSIGATGANKLLPSGMASITIDANVAATISAQVSGPGGLTKNGPGALTLSNAGNDYTGGTVLNAGTLIANSNSALGSGPLMIFGGELASTIDGTTLGNSVTVNGSFTITPPAPGALRLSGPVILNAPNLTITKGSNGSEVDFSGVISGGNGVTLAAQVALKGEFIFSGFASNTFTGLTTVSANTPLFLEKRGGSIAIPGDLTILSGGAVVLGNVEGSFGEQIADTSRVTVNSSGLTYDGYNYGGLNLNGFNETIGALFGDGTVTLGRFGFLEVLAGRLTVGAGNFSGVISDQGFGGQLVKNTPGTLILSGVNTYTGGTSINGGVLGVFNDNNLGAAGAPLTFNGGTLQTLAGLVSSRPTTLNEGGGTIDSNGFDSTFSGVISGAGGLSKTGAGALKLSGVNTYTGGTFIIGGALAISSDSNLGDVAGSLNFSNGGTLKALGTISTSRSGVLGEGGGVIDTNGFDSTFSGVFKGAGGLIKAGAGTLKVTGANTYSGGTSVAGGTLAVFNDNNLGAPAGPLNFSDGGTLKTLAGIASSRSGVLGVGGGAIDTNGFDSEFSGAFSGTGGLTKAGIGTLTLKAANTYSGGTSITGGTVAVFNDNNLGAPAGPLNFSNGGTLKTLAAIASSRSGVFGAGGGEIDTNGFDSFFGGRFSGAGGLTKSGAGALSLTGTSTYSGTTNVNAGELFIDGSIASASTNVAAGALLGGNGTFGGDLLNGGTVSPGHSPGAIVVNQDFKQSSAGTLRIEIGGLSPGQFDLLRVGGSASLAGTLQLAQLNGFQFKLGDNVTFLTAAGGISGVFTTVVNPFSTGTMIGAKLVYGTNSISLQGVQNSFRALVSSVAANAAGLPAPANLEEIPRLPASIMGQTQNQMAVAVALDQSLFDSRNARLIAHLDSEALDKVLRDLDRIAPDELTSIYQIAVAQSKVQSFNLQRRLDDVRSGSNGFSAAGLAMNGAAQGYSGPLGVVGQLEGAQGPDGKSDKRMVMAPSPDNRWGVFVTGNGEWANVGDTSNAAGYDLTSAGFTLGLDYKATPNFVIGLGAGYARGSADLTESGRVTADGGKLSLYTSYFIGGFYADAAVQGGYNNYDTRRNGVNGTARGSTDGGELTTLFGTGYQWKIGGLTFGPTGTFEYTYVGLGSFTETGSLAPLNFPDQHQESIRSTFGAKATYDWKLGSMTLKPDLRVGWQHDYGDTTFGMRSSFANGAGPEFLVHGPSTGRDSLVVGAGVALQINDRVSTYVYYDGELARANYQAHSVSGGFRFDF